MSKSEMCPFCELNRDLVAASALAVAFADGHPVSRGHTLVVPRRHVDSYFDCTHEEKAALWTLVERVREVVVAAHHPDGFNVGFNAGRSAGQTVFHAHIHVIPRYTGDVDNPEGGVRHAVVGHGYYTGNAANNPSQDR